MNEKRAYRKSGRLRFTALVVSLIFAMTSVVWNIPVEAASIPVSSQSLLSLDKLSIPQELGTITRERGVGSQGSGSTNERGALSSSRTVILIQDAHAVVDAQENIRKILAHLGKTYGINLAALEGAKGRLEPILFRTFPEPSVKRRVLAGYEDRAELSGPEMESVFQETPGQFLGMEDWSLYEKNYAAYLAAQGKKDGLLSKWNVFKASLDAERIKVYDQRLNDFQSAWEGFISERSSVLDLLIYLSEFKGLLKASKSGPDGKPYTELPALIDSLGYVKTGKQEALAPIVRQIADQFKTQYLRGLGVKLEMNFYNRYQAFMTGQITAGQMLQFLIQIGAECGKRPKLSPALKKLLGHTEVLSEIKGGRLFEELRCFLPEVQGSLVKNDAQKDLAARYQKLFLLKDMITLELTQDDLAQYQKDPEAYRSLVTDPAFKGDLAPALAFYEAAEERDHAFFGRIETLMKENNQNAVAVVAGGFHTNGLERILREKSVSYAVVTPKIASLAGHENYFKVMKGDVSFKGYLKTTYFDALMRAASKALVDAMPIPDRPQTLKAWRDNVIRELSRQGRITEAGKYLPYIDELLKGYGESVAAGPKRTKAEILEIVRRELDKFQRDSLEKIWKTFEFQLGIFTGGLKRLAANKEMNAQSVSALLSRVSQSKPSVLQAEATMGLDPSIAVRRSVFSASTIARAETQASDLSAASKKEKRSEIRGTIQFEIMDLSLIIHPLDTVDEYAGESLDEAEVDMLSNLISGFKYEGGKSPLNKKLTNGIIADAKQLNDDDMQKYLAQLDISKDIQKGMMGALGVAGQNGVTGINSELLATALRVWRKIQSGRDLALGEEESLYLLKEVFLHEARHQIDYRTPGLFEGLEQRTLREAREQSAIGMTAAYFDGFVIRPGNVFVAGYRFQFSDGSIRRMAYSVQGKEPSEREPLSGMFDQNPPHDFSKIKNVSYGTHVAGKSEPFFPPRKALPQIASRISASVVPEVTARSESRKAAKHGAEAMRAEVKIETEAWLKGEVAKINAASGDGQAIVWVNYEALAADINSFKLMNEWVPVSREILASRVRGLIEHHWDRAAIEFSEESAKETLAAAIVEYATAGTIAESTETRSTVRSETRVPVVHLTPLAVAENILKHGFYQGIDVKTFYPYTPDGPFYESYNQKDRVDLVFNAPPALLGSDQPSYSKLPATSFVLTEVSAVPQEKLDTDVKKILGEQTLRDMLVFGRGKVGHIPREFIDAQATLQRNQLRFAKGLISEDVFSRLKGALNREFPEPGAAIVRSETRGDKRLTEQTDQAEAEEARMKGFLTTGLWLATNEGLWPKGIRSVKGRRGVFLGVGSGGPSMSYGVHGNFDLMIVADINLFVTEVIIPIQNAMIVDSKNRAEYLARYAGVPLNEKEINDLQGRPLAEIHQRLMDRIVSMKTANKEESLTAYSRKTWEEYIDRLPSDRQAWGRKFWEAHHAKFFQLGSLVRMMEQMDSEGNGSWLSSEEAFERIQKMIKSDKIIALTGDWQDKAFMKRVADLVKSRRLKVSVIYSSNMKEMISTSGWKQAEDNLRSLPYEKNTIHLTYALNGPDKGLEVAPLSPAIRSEARLFEKGLVHKVLKFAVIAAVFSVSSFLVQGASEVLETTNVPGLTVVSTPRLNTVYRVANGESVPQTGDVITVREGRMAILKTDELRGKPVVSGLLQPGHCVYEVVQGPGNLVGVFHMYPGENEQDWLLPHEIIDQLGKFEELLRSQGIDLKNSHVSLFANNESKYLFLKLIRDYLQQREASVREYIRTDPQGVEVVIKASGQKVRVELQQGSVDGNPLFEGDMPQSGPLVLQGTTDTEPPNIPVQICVYSILGVFALIAIYAQRLNERAGRFDLSKMTEIAKNDLAVAKAKVTGIFRSESRNAVRSGMREGVTNEELASYYHLLKDVFEFFSSKPFQDFLIGNGSFSDSRVSTTGTSRTWRDNVDWNSEFAKTARQLSDAVMNMRDLLPPSTPVQELPMRFTVGGKSYGRFLNPWDFKMILFPESPDDPIGFVSRTSNGSALLLADKLPSAEPLSFMQRIGLSKRKESPPVQFFLDRLMGNLVESAGLPTYLLRYLETKITAGAEEKSPLVNYYDGPVAGLQRPQNPDRLVQYTTFVDVGQIKGMISGIEKYAESITKPDGSANEDPAANWKFLQELRGSLTRSSARSEMRLEEPLLGQLKEYTGLDSYYYAPGLYRAGEDGDLTAQILDVLFEQLKDIVTRIPPGSSQKVHLCEVGTGTGLMSIAMVKHLVDTLKYAPEQIVLEAIDIDPKSESVAEANWMKLVEKTEKFHNVLIHFRTVREGEEFKFEGAGGYDFIFGNLPDVTAQGVTPEQMKNRISEISLISLIRRVKDQLSLGGVANLSNHTGFVRKEPFVTVRDVFFQNGWRLASSEGNALPAINGGNHIIYEFTREDPSRFRPAAVGFWAGLAGWLSGIAFGVRNVPAILHTPPMERLAGKFKRAAPRPVSLSAELLSKAAGSDWRARHARELAAKLFDLTRQNNPNTKRLFTVEDIISEIELRGLDMNSSLPEVEAIFSDMEYFFRHNSGYSKMIRMNDFRDEIIKALKDIAVKQAQTAEERPVGPSRPSTRSEMRTEVVDILREAKFNLGDATVSGEILLDDRIHNLSPREMALFFNRENRNALLKLASQMRQRFSFEKYQSPDLAPLAYAKKNGLVFEIAPGLFYTPVSESFRRHVVYFGKDVNDSGNALEFKMPGEELLRESIAREHFKVSKELQDDPRTEGISAEPVCYIADKDANVSLYGKNAGPVELMVYRYDDGKRIEKIPAEGWVAMAERARKSVKELLTEVGDKVMALVDSLHKAGWSGMKGIDFQMHLANMRLIETVESVDGEKVSHFKVKAAGDNAIYYKPWPILRDPIFAMETGRISSAFKTIKEGVPLKAKSVVPAALPEQDSAAKLHQLAEAVGRLPAPAFVRPILYPASNEEGMGRLLTDLKTLPPSRAENPVFVGISGLQNYDMAYARFGVHDQYPEVVLLDLNPDMITMHEIFKEVVLRSPTPEVFREAFAKSLFAEFGEKGMVRLREERTFEKLGFLKSDLEFTYVKELIRRGKVVALQADLSVPATSQTLRAWLDHNDRKIDACYLSNATAYYWSAALPGGKQGLADALGVLNPAYLIEARFEGDEAQPKNVGFSPLILSVRPFSETEYARSEARKEPSHVSKSRAIFDSLLTQKTPISTQKTPITVVSVGPGVPIDVGAVNWEELAVTRGEKLKIYEPDIRDHQDWERFKANHSGKDIEILPPAQAAFENNSLQADSVDLLIINSVFSAGIDDEVKQGIVRQVGRVLRVGGLLVVGYYLGEGAKEVALERKLAAQAVTWLKEDGFRLELTDLSFKEPKSLLGAHGYLVYKILEKPTGQKKLSRSETRRVSAPQLDNLKGKNATPVNLRSEAREGAAKELLMRNPSSFDGFQNNYAVFPRDSKYVSEFGKEIVSIDFSRDKGSVYAEPHVSGAGDIWVRENEMVLVPFGKDSKLLTQHLYQCSAFVGEITVNGIRCHILSHNFPAELGKITAYVAAKIESGEWKNPVLSLSVYEGSGLEYAREWTDNLKTRTGVVVNVQSFKEKGRAITVIEDRNDINRDIWLPENGYGPENIDQVVTYKGNFFKAVPISLGISGATAVSETVKPEVPSGAETAEVLVGGALQVPVTVPEALDNPAIGAVIERRAENRLSELRKQTEIEKDVFLSVIEGKQNVLEFLNSAAFLQEVKDAMPVLVEIAGEERTNELVVAVQTAVLIPTESAGPGSAMLDMKPLNGELIRMTTNRVREAIGKLKGPHFTVVMNHPGANSEEVLKALKANPPDRIVVIYKKGQIIGTAWRGLGVPVNSMSAGRQPMNKLFEKAVSGAESAGEQPFGLLTEPIDLGQLNFLKILAEIGKLSNEDLRELVCTSAMLVFRIYAGLDKSKQDEVLAGDATPILHKLEELGVHVPGLTSKNGVFSFQMNELIRAFEGRSSIEKAA